MLPPINPTFPREIQVFLSFTPEQLVEKLLSKRITIPESNCWFWSAAKSPRGYGMLHVRVHTDQGRGAWRRSKVYTVYAHRLSWMLHNGQVIPDKHVIRHICDNPSCFNPHHLRIGTPHDNAMDLKRRGSRRYQLLQKSLTGFPLFSFSYFYQHDYSSTSPPFPNSLSITISTP